MTFPAATPPAPAPGAAVPAPVPATESPPTVITVSVVLAEVIGAFWVMVGLVGLLMFGVAERLLPESARAPAGAFITGLCVAIILVGLGVMACGGYLWRRRTWARIALMVVAVLGLLSVITGTLLQPSVERLSTVPVGAGVDAALLWLLLTRQAERYCRN